MTSPQLQPARTRRRDAARLLLHPEQFKDSLSLTRQASLRNATLAGFQAALTVAVALPLVVLSPWAQLIGFASLGALVALFGRFAPAGRRQSIVLQCGLLQTAAVLLMSLAAWLGASQGLQLILLALWCGVALFVSIAGRFGAPGALIFVFAASAAMAPELTLGQVVERSAATAIVAALAWLICLATEAVRHAPPPARDTPEDPLPPLRSRLIAAARTVAGAALAIGASLVLDGQHPAWAAMGALAVMQGPQLHIVMNRALQRMGGTVIGALLAWLLLLQDPSVWILIAALAALQLLTEMVIGVNYALGQVLVTPMALLMTYLGAGRAVGPDMASDRILETLIGVAVGVVLSVAFSSADERTHLARRRVRTD
ncbi:FUSC family protein [Brevundimonas naejangsanensis]|uniref:FUSC family protein n=1 Tax=Brevundimonas naejangsanensis TaxID=588932 RepID=A0A494RG68_9CAUL|nr:FUSC family protein [Brevundimonas naejangsanensis]AYG94429.1 FUSC family protein [Brevundimonas naejangsanensis]